VDAVGAEYRRERHADRARRLRRALDALGVASAIAIAAIALLTWRHGQAIYRDRSPVGTYTDHQPGALGLLTAATLVIAAVAIIVTILWSG
jgi:hypothetical protein